MKKIIAAVLCLVMLAGCLASCGSEDPVVLFFAVEDSAGSFDPQIVSDTTASIVVRNCFEGLLRKDENGEIVNGVATLVKDYGPLHVLYPIYLISYFVTMVITIIHSHRKGNLSSAKYAFFLVGVVLTNLIVWGVEQAVRVNFEFLSVSYQPYEVLCKFIFNSNPTNLHKLCIFAKL